jgi:transposase
MMASKDKNLVIVHAVTEQHLTPAQAAARYRISRQWVYELLHRYAAGGEAALAPRSRAPKTRPAATPPAVTARITALRRELTADGRDAGPETIAWHLHREGLHTPATSTIRRILHQAGMITPAPRKPPAAATSASKPTCPTDAGKPTSPTGTCTAGNGSRSSTSSMTTPATCCTCTPKPLTPEQMSSPP